MSIFLNRKSIRKYDENYKIKKEELNEILKLSLRAPSSMNLQPTRLIVVESEEAKEKIRSSMTANLLQLNTSSHFIIISTDLNKFKNGIEVFDTSEKLGYLPADVSKRQKQMIKDRDKSYSIEKIMNEGHLDAGLVAMQLMLVAKDFGYDTCPIAGFKKDTILKDLGINDDAIKPILIVSIGKADEDGYPTYRRDLDEVVSFY